MNSIYFSYYGQDKYIGNVEVDKEIINHKTVSDIIVCGLVKCKCQLLCSEDLVYCKEEKCETLSMPMWK